MSYYKVLGFDREPFSTSPDPDFLYMSGGYEAALANTLIELNLRRGLSVILGDVGMGKTTLSRKLIKDLAKREKFIFQMILNPSFEDEEQFLHTIVENFDIPMTHSGGKNTLIKLRNTFEKYLLNKTVNEGKTVTLIIDEAQKLTNASLETLRILLNYETNTFKMIQIVLLGQLELYSNIAVLDNFYDRISFQCSLNPLELEETRDLINYRIVQAGYKSKSKLFLESAIKEIYQCAKGRPRKIIMLCHKAIKKMLLEKRYVVDELLIKSIIAEESNLGWQRKNLLLKNSY